jgi:hypothetical protein
MLARSVHAEVLDGLAAEDPAAVRARGDLRRIHRVMGTCGILRRAVRRCLDGRRGAAPLRILELGSGDGTLMLRLARLLAPRWPGATLCLLDREPLLRAATLDAYAALGWTVRPERIDVLQWASRADGGGGAAGGNWDLIVANLFLHHFEGAALAGLMRSIGERCNGFVAVEPRRSRLALSASHLVGALGANAVTREDAVLSVRAGFRGAEIGALWSAPQGDWTCREYAAGLFSHVFLAMRRAPEAP